MINDIKVILFFVGVAVVSAIVKFKTWIQLILDIVLGFTMGYVSYLALSYFNLSGETKSGISGVIILYARPLYDFLNSVISTKLMHWLDYKVKNDNKDME